MVPRGCNASTGVWINGGGWFFLVLPTKTRRRTLHQPRALAVARGTDECGALCVPSAGAGNNQSPFYITEEVANATGLPNSSVIAITTWSDHPRGHPSQTNATLNAYFAVGIANTWRDPIIINPTPLFLGGVLTGWEDPYIW